MSFSYVALQDFPARLWMLDGVNSFPDYTGFSSPLTPMPVKNLATAAEGGGVGLGNVTVTNNVSYTGLTWTRVLTNETAHGFRWTIPLSLLRTGATYTASVEVANSSASPLDISLDWCDVGPTSFTIQPGEIRRVSVTTATTINAIYRFMDLAVSVAGTSVLFRNPMITEGSTLYPYFDGNTPGHVVDTNYVLNPRPTSTNFWYANNAISTLSLDEQSRIKLVFNGVNQTAQCVPDSRAIPVKQGDKCWVTFKYQGPGGRLSIVHHRAYDQTILGQTTPTLPASPDAETTVKFEIVANNPNTRSLYLAQLCYAGPPPTNGETHYFREVTFTKGASAPEFFDGSSTSINHVYAWEGAPNGSKSFKMDPGYLYSWDGAASASPSSMISPMPRHAALIKGAMSSVLVGNSNKLYYDAPIMKRGREDQSFTIEVTVRPIKKEESVAQQQIFGTASAMDGLVIAGTMLSFTTKYTNTGEARCEFDLEEYRSVTIAAGHTKKANYLYVNGDLVDEVEITPEQQADTYLSAGTNLSSGTTTSANLLALNGLAIYPHILLESDIDQHYDEAADNMDEFGVASGYGASIFALNSTTSIPLQETSYLDDVHWYTGRISGTAVEYGQIVPQFSGGVSIPGLWETIVPLPVDTTLSSVTLDWQGTGAIVQTSTDGLVWSNPERRSARISTIPDGFNTSGRFLYLRVSFPGGKVEDKSYFDGLVITAYGPINTTAPSLETRTLTLNSGSIEADYDITEYHENWGIEIVNGFMSLSGASQTASAPRTIQVWARKGLTGTFTDNLQSAATAWYTNNGTYNQEWQTDEWQLRTYIFASGHQQAISFTGTGQIGPILIYPYAMTAQNINDTYEAFTGTKSFELTTSGTIGFVDLSHLTDIYEYNWAIESAG